MLEFNPTPQAVRAWKEMRFPLNRAVRGVIDRLCATGGREPPSRSVPMLLDFSEVILKHPSTGVPSARVVFKVVGDELRVPVIERI